MVFLEYFCNDDSIILLSLVKRYVGMSLKYCVNGVGATNSMGLMLNVVDLSQISDKSTVFGAMY